jgi:LuxR family maltose regulon positive regulatory protein
LRQEARIPAKLARPLQSGVVARNRAFQILDGAQPVAWITGPPGAGKTTLVASFLETRKLRSLWYQIDEGDGDVATLFYYLRQAAVRAAPRKRWRLPLLTSEYLAGVDTFARRWFEELFDGLPNPSALVFDNYQDAPAESQLHEVLRAAFESMPRGDRAIVISRGEAGPAFARLRAGGNIGFLGPQTLRLTAGETRAIAQLKTGRRVSAKQTRALHEATDGWAAGVVLMLEHDAAAGIAIPRQHPPQAIFDYFATEILLRSDRETQQVVLETALLPKVTGAQAEAITGLPRAGEILAGLARQGYFTDAYSDPEPAYQFHPLFREFLLSRRIDTISEERRDDIQRTAVALLEHAGHVEDAALLLGKARDWDGLARLVAIHAPLLLRQGRISTVHRWLQALPAETLDTSPWLLFWLAACQLGHDPEESLKHATCAFDRFRSAGDRAGMLSAWSMAVDAIFYGWGDLTRLDSWIAILESLLAERGDFPSPQIDSQVTASMFTALVWRQMGHRDIVTWAERAEAAFHANVDIGLRARIGQALANYFVWLGDLRRAETITNALANYVSEDAAPNLPRLWLFVIESTMAWIRADPERCRRIASKGLAVARNAGVAVIDDHLEMCSVFGALIAGDVAEAAKTLEIIRRGLGECKYVALMGYHNLASWASMLAGNLADAHNHAETALEFAIRCGGLFSISICRSALAQTLFERGERDGARAQLTESTRLAIEIRSRPAECCALLADAYFSLCEGAEAHSLAPLRRALQLFREHGLLAVAWWRPKMVARLCAKALEAGIEVECARRLIKAHDLVPDPEQPPPEGWPWPVRVTASGGFGVIVDGRPVVFATKAQRKPLELLKALVAFGCDDVAEQDIADALWPDADGDAAQDALAVTLYRLRRLLRHHQAIHRQGGRMDLDSKRVWVDVRALETCLAAQPTRADGAAFIDSALRLYRGPLLAGEKDEPWVLAPRERLQSRVRRRLGELGGILEASGDLDRAANCYLKALEIDEGVEEMYRRLISLHQRVGRRAEALALYDRCGNALARAPSAETRAALNPSS